MKLLQSLSELILEVRKQDIKRAEISYGDKIIKIISTYHQWFERHGDQSYQEILNLYDKVSLKDYKYRIGVPDNMIINLIKNNLQKITGSFDQLQPGKNRVLFIKKRVEDYDRDPVFNFIEFVLQKNSDTEYLIITSAFSDDGLFLYLGTKEKTTRVFVEHKDYSDYLIVHL